MFRYVLASACLATAAFALPLTAGAIAPAVLAKVGSALPDATTAGVNRFIVTYRAGAAERNDRSLAALGVTGAIRRSGLLAARKASATTTARYVRSLATGAGLIEVPARLNAVQARALMQEIAADASVAHVEADVMMQAVGDIQAPPVHANAIPDDPLYAANQWHFFDATGGVNLPQALDLADGSGVTVAVIDTGITAHPDLDTSLADAGYDFISDGVISGRGEEGRAPGGWDTGDWTDDAMYAAYCANPKASSWHGTHVAGTVAELTGNALGLVGVAGMAKVLPVRVLGHCGGATSDIADAVVWAAGGHVDGVPDNAHPAQVINMSLGGAGTCTVDDAMGTAIALANARGTTVLVAAGNENIDAINVSPASCPGAVTVASTGITGVRAYYSGYGDTVALSAPGGGIYVNDDPATGEQASPEGFVWSTMNDGGHEPGNPVYGGYAGTSQATPHVAGTVALMQSAAQQAGLPPLSTDMVANILKTTARAFPVVPTRKIGSGILDSYQAVRAAVDGAIPLAAGQNLAGQNAGTGSSLVYAFDVPANARALTVRSSGGTGSTDLYLKAGSAPATDGADAQYTSKRPGTGDAIVVTNPAAGRYYLRLLGTSAFKGVNVLAATVP